jgi:hypothetical protein
VPQPGVSSYLPHLLHRFLHRSHDLPALSNNSLGLTSKSSSSTNKPSMLRLHSTTYWSTPGGRRAGDSGYGASVEVSCSPRVADRPSCAAPGFHPYHGSPSTTAPSSHPSLSQPPH